MTTLRAFAGPLLAALLAACAEPPPLFAEAQRLGGRSVPAAMLEAGRRHYLHYCRTCHGVDGDGRGPTAPALQPPPRDFTRAVFKFGSVPAGRLPTDDDLRRIVRDGLRGTAMLGWNVPDDRLDAILQYVKTFSPRWREEEPGEPVVAEPDPWIGKPLDGVNRGRLVYHGLARCLACHPAYVPMREIAAAARALGAEPPEPRPDPFRPAPGASDYGSPLLASDFTRSDLRSVRDRSRLPDLWRVIAAGVGGTAMPTWKGALRDEDLWALARYVESLAAMKGTRDAEDLAWRLAVDAPAQLAR